MLSLIKLLSINKSSKDAIKKKHSKINIRQNNIALTLFILFLLWNKLLKIFNDYKTLLKIYQDYYWIIWKDISKNWKKYALYITKNLFQFKKS